MTISAANSFNAAASITSRRRSPFFFFFVPVQPTPVVLAENKVTEQPSPQHGVTEKKKTTAAHYLTRADHPKRKIKERE
jgi:hypothetical protein